MDLRDYVRTFKRSWWLVAGLTLLGVVVGIGITLTSTKVYQANVQLFVAAYTDDSQALIAQGNQFAQTQAQSYTSFVSDPRVLQPTNARLGRSPGGVSADAPTGKVLINLHVTDKDPKFAAVYANTLAEQFAKVVSSTAKQSPTAPEVVALTVINPATTPGAPIEPDPVRDIGLGLVVGLLVGLCAAVARDRLGKRSAVPAETA